MDRETQAACGGHTTPSPVDDRRSARKPAASSAISPTAPAPIPSRSSCSPTSPTPQGAQTAACAPTPLPPPQSSTPAPAVESSSEINRILSWSARRPFNSRSAARFLPASESSTSTYSDGSSTICAKITALAAANGPPAPHHRCSVLGCPCRIDFSRDAALLMASKGSDTSINFFRNAHRTTHYHEPASIQKPRRAVLRNIDAVRLPRIAGFQCSPSSCLKQKTMECRPTGHYWEVSTN